MQKITKEDLLNSGAHFGHVSSKTDPNFKDFVVSQKNGIDIINLDDTLEGLDKALNFISNIYIYKYYLSFKCPTSKTIFYKPSTRAIRN